MGKGEISKIFNSQLWKLTSHGNNITAPYSTQSKFSNANPLFGDPFDNGTDLMLQKDENQDGASILKPTKYIKIIRFNKWEINFRITINTPVS